MTLLLWVDDLCPIRVHHHRSLLDLSLPSVDVDQDLSGLRPPFEPSRGRVIWALQWGYPLALISPSPCRHCRSSHLQSGDTSATGISVAE